MNRMYFLPSACHARPVAVKKFVLGLCGKTGSGKSTVAGMLRERGAPVMDGDQLGHQVLAMAAVRLEICKAFGMRTFDRPALAARVFSNPRDLARLSQITWPWIRKKIQAGILGAPHGLIVVDAAILLEAGWRDLVDKALVVEAPEVVRVQRLRKKGLTLKQASQRIVAQRRQKAGLGVDEVLPNSSGFLDLKITLDKILSRWEIIHAS